MVAGFRFGGLSPFVPDISGLHEITTRSRYTGPAVNLFEAILMKFNSGLFRLGFRLPYDLLLLPLQSPNTFSEAPISSLAAHWQGCGVSPFALWGSYPKPYVLHEICHTLRGHHL